MRELRVVVLGAPGWHTHELCRALAARGHAPHVVAYEALVARLGQARSRTGTLTAHGVAVLDADVVLARFVPAGSLEQIIYRMDALHWIERRGVPVVNAPRAIERSVDKFLATALLQDAGLPTLETVVCETAADAMAAIGEMGDVVIKPIFGSMGHGMVRVSDPDVALRIVRALEEIRAVFYVQRAVEHGGRDVRAFVIDGSVVAAIERRAPRGEWRTNVSRGGSARAVTLSPADEQLAVRAAATVGADYAGVDLLPSPDGSVFVLEVNGIPGWRGLQQATGISVAEALAAHVERTVARRGDTRSTGLESAPSRLS